MKSETSLELIKGGISINDSTSFSFYYVEVNLSTTSVLTQLPSPLQHPEHHDRTSPQPLRVLK